MHNKGMENLNVQELVTIQLPDCTFSFVGEVGTRGEKICTFV
jgi:hypothetical protein